MIELAGSALKSRLKSVLKTRVFDIALDGAFYVPLGNRLLFIVRVFTAAKRDFDFDERVLKIEL